jgi:TnpA family transposase
LVSLTGHPNCRAIAHGDLDPRRDGSGVRGAQALKRLAVYPRQNGLAVALREVGRLERSLFALNWMRDIDLRRRVSLGLNKGEARNALARAVFFHRLGELRDRSVESQDYRASGLNRKRGGADALPRVALL